MTDSDCDDDGLLDPDEIAPECVTDSDCDDDGLLDPDEIAPECVTDSDCDDDGLLDGEEVAPECITDSDCDDDGILDPDEIAPECVTDPDLRCGEDDDSFPWWILIVAGAVLLLAARIFMFLYLGRRSPRITHIAISEFDSGVALRKAVETETNSQLTQDSEIDYLSDVPGLKAIKFTIRMDSGKLEYGSMNQPYSNEKDLPSHVLELNSLPVVVNINGLVSEIIWSIKAKRTLGTTFSLEFEIDGEWTEISEITNGDIEFGEDFEIPAYCRVVANSPFRTKRYSNSAPLGAINLFGVSEPKVTN